MLSRTAQASGIFGVKHLLLATRRGTLQRSSEMQQREARQHSERTRIARKTAEEVAGTRDGLALVQREVDTARQELTPLHDEVSAVRQQGVHPLGKGMIRPLLGANLLGLPPTSGQDEESTLRARACGAGGAARSSRNSGASPHSSSTAELTPAAAALAAAGGPAAPRENSPGRVSVAPPRASAHETDRVAAEPPPAAVAATAATAGSPAAPREGSPGRVSVVASQAATSEAHALDEEEPEAGQE